MKQDRNALAALGLRPFSARSVVASCLLGSHPPELPTAGLVRLCTRFGIAEGTARVALSRMVAAGEIAATGGGYRLVGEALLSRQISVDEAQRPPEGPWNGYWRMAVVVSGARGAAERGELRRAFIAGRFAEWREGVWLRPDNLPPISDGPLDPSGPCRWMRSCLEEDPRGVASELWDLPGWKAHGETLLELTAAEPGDLRHQDDEASAMTFAGAAALVRAIRSDPLLPRELLPEGWPARALRARYDTHRRSLQQMISASASPG
jgi:phenylacetic acid degradation operon negative regulatory protein